jgi:hypothetical protein
MPRAGVSVTPGRTYRGEEDPEIGEDRRPAERRASRASSERTARLPRDGAGRAIRPPHVRLASMAEVTAELDFTPRPRARRTSSPAEPRAITAPRTGAQPRVSSGPRASTAPRAAPRPVAATELSPHTSRPFDSERASQTAEPPAVMPGSTVNGRRTVTIHGRGSERYSPTTQRRRPARRPHEREGFRPDRAAMWAVMLGFILVLVAATSSHAATITPTHRSAQRQLTIAHHGVHRHTSGTAVLLRVR